MAEELRIVLTDGGGGSGSGSGGGGSGGGSGTTAGGGGGSFDHNAEIARLHEQIRERNKRENLLAEARGETDERDQRAPWVEGATPQDQAQSDAAKLMEQIRERNKRENLMAEAMGQTAEQGKAAPWVEGADERDQAQADAARIQDQIRQRNQRENLLAEAQGRTGEQEKNAPWVKGVNEDDQADIDAAAKGPAKPEASGIEQLLGMAGGGMGGLMAAAGPAGMAIAAAMKIKEEVKEGIRAVGQAGGRAAALDTGGMFDGMTKSMEMFGAYGEYMAEATKGLKLFADGLSMTAKRLAPFSGPLASAEAMADVSQIRGDVRRAQVLGPELAEFVNARSKLEQTGQDLLVQLIKPLIPIVTRLIEILTNFLEDFSKGFEVLSDTVVFGINALIDGVNMLVKLATLGKEEKYLQRIEQNTRPPQNMDILLDELLTLSPGQQPNLFAPEQHRPAVPVGEPVFGGA